MILSWYSAFIFARYQSKLIDNSLAYKKVEYFTKALQLNPNLVQAYEQRGLHYYFQADK